MIISTALAAGLGAAAAPAVGAGIRGIGALVSGQAKSRRQFKDLLKSKVDRMRSGNLGMDKATKMQVMGEVKSDLNATMAAQNEELRRGVAASGLGGVSKSAEIAGAQAAVKSDTLAKARTELQKQSDEIAQRQYAEGQEALAQLAGMASPVANALADIATTGISAGMTERFKNPEGSFSGQAQRTAYENQFKQGKEAGLPDAIARRMAIAAAKGVQ